MPVWGSETEMASGVSEGSGMTGTIVDGRTRVEEYLLRTNGRGEMVSMLGPCVCGVGKKEWHPVCLTAANGDGSKTK